MNKKVVVLSVLCIVLAAVGFYLYLQPATPASSDINIDPDEKDPAVWGEIYPDHYDTHMMTAEGGTDHSKYRGSDDWDRLSGWPFQFVLMEGWGMGTDYRMSRGHVHALYDQLHIHESRRAGGGACLTCKSPYVPDLQEEMGIDYYRLPYDEVHNQIPEEHQELGISCVDCHDGESIQEDPKALSLGISRQELIDALESMGKDTDNLTTQEKRSLVCAQCHVDYAMPKDEEGRSVDVLFPWRKAEWEEITIEAIVEQTREDELYEWEHAVTGMDMGHIRHPEFELYSNNSTHWEAGLSCADCHMPNKDIGKNKITDHQATSPLKKDLEACVSCHDQSTEKLRERIFDIQDRTNHTYTRAGFAAAEAAKAIEMANETEGIDEELLDKAKNYYEKAYYFITIIGAENSMGFHNPSESMRVLSDGLNYARKSESYSRQALQKAGVNPPDEFDLELDRYDYDPDEDRSKLMYQDY